MSDPRYPIGKFEYNGTPTPEQRLEFISNIEQTPARLRAAVSGLSDAQLNTPYRDGGRFAVCTSSCVRENFLRARTLLCSPNATR